MKLKQLIKKIRDENKIPTDELFEMMIDEIYECDEEHCRSIYEKMYIRAYGEHLTREIAEEWVRSMEVNDDSGKDNGQKWTMEQTTDVGNKIGIDWSVISKIDWYIAMNMEYSKHYRTAKRVNAESDAMFFADLVKDEWLNSERTMFDYYFEYVI